MTTDAVAQEANSQTTSYTTATTALQSTVVALLACQFVTVMAAPDIKLDTPLDAATNLHFNFWLAILAVMATGLVYRWRHPMDVALGEPPGWEQTLALATHLLAPSPT
jgi:cytochrome b561